MQTSMSSMNQHFNPDPFGILSSCLEVQKAWLEHPNLLTDQYWKLATQMTALESWQYWTSGAFHADLFPAVEYDKRFQLADWEENPALDTLKEMYLMTTRWLEDAIFETPGVDDKTRRRAAFWTRQLLNALSPSNFLATNPEALHRLISTQGASLLEGWQLLLKDIQRGTVSMVSEDAFTIGKDIATTPGAVVFRNELLELIQYEPSTKKVHEVPIVIISPWINKYYILDINEKKSLIKYLVDQGYTVFVTSWKNPGSEMRDTKMDDYMLNGALEAVNVAREICDVPQVHLTGYCIGGTLVSSLMAWLNQAVEAGEIESMPVAHWTLFTTLVDFANPGDIDVFIDESIVEVIEQRMKENGYLDGDDLAMSFRMLRSNSLIWHYVVTSYLCGEPPPSFDVLYWNMDNTRLPEAMHSQYLRDLYLENKLIAGEFDVAGRKLDLNKISQPLYAVGTEQDHIVPWKEAFKTASAVSSPVRFTLATSGHILGVISPPVDPPKRRYWVSDVDKSLAPDAWMEETEKVPGSWWIDWLDWMAPKSGKQVTPPSLGGEHYPVLDPAPGTYVFES